MIKDPSRSSSKLQLLHIKPLTVHHLYLETSHNMDKYQYIKLQDNSGDKTLITKPLQSQHTEHAQNFHTKTSNTKVQCCPLRLHAMQLEVTQNLPSSGEALGQRQMTSPTEPAST